MIVLTLPYPISANRYWATRVVLVKGRQMPIVYVTSEAQAYRRQVDDICLAAGIRQPLTGRIAMAVRLFPARPQDWARRARKLGAAWDNDVRCIDLDNANKVLLDALKGIAFEDDKWVRRLQSERMEPDEHGARVIVAIERMAIEQRQGDLLVAVGCPDCTIYRRLAAECASCGNQFKDVQTDPLPTTPARAHVSEAA